MEKMTIRLEQLLSIRSVLQELFNKELPVDVSWELSKLIKQIENHYEDFELNRVKILKSYIKDGEEKVPENELDDFKEKIEELLNIDIELEHPLISINKLKEENIKISPMALSKLDFLFEI